MMQASLGTVKAAATAATPVAGTPTQGSGAPGDQKSGTRRAEANVASGANCEVASVMADDDNMNDMDDNAREGDANGEKAAQAEKTEKLAQENRERIERRRIKNREAARRFQSKRKTFMDNLQYTIAAKVRSRTEIHHERA